MRLLTTLAVLAAALVFFAPGSQLVSAQTKKTEPQNHKTKSLKIIVKAGDTLTKIAKKHRTTYVRLFDANPRIKDPDLIYPGDKIRIPDRKEKIKHRLSVKADPAPVTYIAPRVAKPVGRPRTAYVVPRVNLGGVWDRLAQCESGGNWGINTGNGFYGGLQFTLSSWRGVGGSGYPNQASRSEQIARAQILKARSGWGNWPACSARLGLL